MRRRLADYRLTPAGGGLLLVLAAALTVLLIGPHHDERPAVIVLVIVLAMFAANTGANGRSANRFAQQSLAERQRHFRPRRRRAADTPDRDLEAEAWRREREAYEERNRGPHV